MCADNSPQEILKVALDNLAIVHIKAYMAELLSRLVDHIFSYPSVRFNHVTFSGVSLQVETAFV